MKFDANTTQRLSKKREGVSRTARDEGWPPLLLGHSLRSPLKIEPYLITLDATSDAYPVFQHPGHEFSPTRSGKVTYRHGDRSYLLEPETCSSTPRRCMA